MAGCNTPRKGQAGALGCGSRLIHYLWSFGVLITKARRRIASDRLAMAKPGSIEGKTGKFALALTTFLQILEANGITKAHDVRAHISREQHSSRTPQQRDLSGAMPGDMNYLEAACDRQGFPWGQRLVDGNRVHSLFGMEEQIAQNSPQQARRRRHRPKRTSTLGDRDVERVHVGPRTGSAHDSGGAANMIRVGVSENEVLELVWRTAKPADRPEDHRLLARETGVNQRQPVVTLDQEGVCKPHRDDVHTFDYALHIQ